MTDAFTRLVFVNLAFTAGLIVVFALRKPVRIWFGARAAYVLWLLPLLSLAATFVPPRVVTVLISLPKSATPFVSAFVHAESVATPDLDTPASPTAPMISSTASAIDPWTIAMIAWLAGAILMAAWFALRQSRFMAEVRAGKAGPAVVGLFRPRIITPSDFEARFEPGERDVILTHEKVHLARHDAHANALVALIRCLCWYNPLVHVAAHCLRIDQELACDALVIQRHPKSRRVYADALLKAELAARPLPLGCYWPPGAEHPLMERIEMLKRSAPGRVRRIGGLIVLGSLLSATSLAAWAALPPTQLVVITPQPETPAFTASLQPDNPGTSMPAPVADQPAPPSPSLQPDSRVLQPIMRTGPIEAATSAPTRTDGGASFSGNVQIRTPDGLPITTSGKTQAPSPASVPSSPSAADLMADVDTTTNLIALKGNVPITKGDQTVTADEARIQLDAPPPGAQPTRIEPQQQPPAGVPNSSGSTNPIRLKGEVKNARITPVSLTMTVSASGLSLDGRAAPETRTWLVTGKPGIGKPEDAKDLLGKEVAFWGYQSADNSCSSVCRMYAADFMILKPNRADAASGQVESFALNKFWPFPEGGYAFASKFDIEAQVLIKGVIEKVEFSLPYIHVWVRGAAADGQEKLWLADGPRPAAVSDEAHLKLTPGARVTIRGYFANDRTCDPACRVNARDISFGSDQPSRPPSPSSPSVQPISYEPPARSVLQ